MEEVEVVLEEVEVLEVVVVEVVWYIVEEVESITSCWCVR